MTTPEPCGGEVDWWGITIHSPYRTRCRRCSHEVEHLDAIAALEATARACQRPAAGR